MRTAIRNARTIEGSTQPGRDLYLEDGLVAGWDLGGTVDREVDATGLTLAPALIDLHAHLRDPGQEVKEDLASGLAAAAAGGYGTVVSMPNTRPVVDDPGMVADLVERAESLGLARLRPAAALTRGQEGKLLSDAAALQAAGAVMLTDDGRTNEDAGVLRRGLEYAGSLGLVVSVHAEDAGLRGNGVMNEGAVSERLGLPGNPATAEAARVARDLEICALTGARLHVQHLSTARALELVRDAKRRGLPVTCEVTPHHLTLTDDAFEAEGSFCDPVLKVAPPLRTRSDAEVLIGGLLDGTVDCIATDHAPHTRSEKELDMLDAPFGIANIELCFPLLFTHLVANGRLPLSRLVELLTTGPARVMGWPEPSLKAGVAADVVLLDLDAERPVDPSSLKTKAKFSPWDGQVLKGWPSQGLNLALVL
ncbi:MAG TPA: dihydroorotase, partial [Deinococcales bacterium]|nr:dihydroorotase [Deinococcales bacterium]